MAPGVLVGQGVLSLATGGDDQFAEIASAIGIEDIIAAGFADFQRQQTIPDQRWIARHADYQPAFCIDFIGGGALQQIGSGAAVRPDEYAKEQRNQYKRDGGELCSHSESGEISHEAVHCLRPFTSWIAVLNHSVWETS
jgi:hypothetical protein